MSFRTIIFPLFLFLSFSLTAQQVNWLQSYNPQQTNSPRDLTIQNDGPLFTGGYYLEGGIQIRKAFILSVDAANGDSLTMIECEAGVLCDSRKDVLHLAKNAAGAVFTTGNLDFGSSDYLAKINGGNDLTIDWIIDDLTVGNIIHHINVLEIVSDGIIIAGTFSETDYAIMKFDFDGNNMWSTKIPVTEIGREPIMTITTDENAIILYTDGLNDGIDKLSRIDTDGNILWTIPIIGQKMLTIAAGLNNQFYSFDFLESTWGDEIYRLVQHDADGTPTVLNTNCGINFPEKMIVNQAGEIFASASFYDANSDYGFGLAKFSSNGTLLFNANFKEEGFEDNFFDMELLDEQTVIMIGRRTADIPNISQRTVSLISIDGSSGSTSTNDLTDTKLLQLAPNPVEEKIQLAFASASNARFNHYELFNTQGQMLKSEHIDQAEELSINVVGLPTGTYLIRVKDQDGHFYSKRFNKL